MVLFPCELSQNRHQAHKQLTACALNCIVKSQATTSSAAAAPNPQTRIADKTAGTKTAGRTGAKAGAKKVKVHLTSINGMYCRRCLVSAMYKSYV